jgi:hypothetical protein
VKNKASAFLDPYSHSQIIVIDDEYKGLIDYLEFENTKLYKFGSNNESYSNILVVKNWLEIITDISQK